MKSLKRFLFLMVLINLLSLNLVIGQQVPEYPVSYRLYTPFVFNPAIAGSKDFSEIDLLFGNYGNSNSQLAGGNFRIAKSRKEYLTSVSVPEFTNFGAGGFIFNDKNDTSRNIGAGLTGSYHLQLDKKALSFLSFGVTVKAIYNDFPGNTDLNKPAEKTFFPNVDAGIYYYTSSYYAGISATNLLGNPNDPDSLGYYTIPASGQIFFNAGYKFVLSRTWNILLEPFLIVNTDFEFSGEVTDWFKPGLKLYAGNFCAGTYFNDFNKISFLFQYRYNKVYVGSYFEMFYNEPFYKQPILAELVFGINLSAVRSGLSRHNHW